MKRKNKETDKETEQTVDQQSDAEAQETAEQASPTEAEQEPQAQQGEPQEQDLQEKVRELNDKYLRAKAQYDNYRKRMQREFDDVRKETKASTLAEFLTVYDHFQMALQHAENQGDYATLKQGIDMIYNEFGKAFENLNVMPIHAEGKTFEPNLHEAVGHEHSDEVPAGQVIKQYQCGYQVNDRLVRPARVVVSAGPEQEQAAAEDEHESVSQSSSEAQEEENTNAN